MVYNVLFKIFLPGAPEVLIYHPTFSPMYYSEPWIIFYCRTGWAVNALSETSDVSGLTSFPKITVSIAAK